MNIQVFSMGPPQFPTGFRFAAYSQPADTADLLCYPHTAIGGEETRLNLQRWPWKPRLLGMPGSEVAY
ncbi:hypothetical protein [Lichenifustis flavocetrariae]|uniref:Uncharacterized protein n=1 Tax=Lichenifustis flavocetrariae TaxID=2949735 RepID=A0AA41Z3Y5_9HYPH|nr:hypothetical protein [Lichenifustis flavocetrariae]MCW6512345.1 hypothetical protein [Lichenifustis flavocetrariae]